MKNYFKTIIFVVLLIIISGCNKKTEENGTVIINDKVINIEIADSWSERSRGLSGRNSLCENCGLLFIFNKKDKHSFWMKDMKFSIDIIWINDSKIVHMVENAPPPNGGNVPSYTPISPANKVLELNSGFVKENNIKVGDIIKF